MNSNISSEEIGFEKEIIFSKNIKAGSRVYYIDVKKSRKDDMYITITESKRVSSKEEEVPRYEKHKLFLYKEDFTKFKEGLNEAIEFISNE
ncbi:MAG: DUF3276 family protein [Bacteroidales bacterium]|nr:DUF3276 family protein [Bacteroidales bacterium]MBQ7819321.1 DUF3276 family protein [Bacteroidales bacterium]